MAGLGGGPGRLMVPAERHGPVDGPDRAARAGRPRMIECRGRVAVSRARQGERKGGGKWG